MSRFGIDTMNRGKILMDVSTLALGACVAFSSIGCSSQPVPGPDKLGRDEGLGAIQGAGAGMVVGAQVGAGTGPGAAIGAGFGAIAGAIQGLMKDTLEETDIKNEREIRATRSRLVAQDVLAKHYEMRMQMHPGRDIYPADVFFQGDSAKMCPQGVAIVKEIARMNEFRLPYSRIIVASYAKSVDPESTYVSYLTERRAREFVNQLVRAGVEPRRLETRAVVVDAPVLIDPNDNPTRYNQAIEIIPVDK
jgi:outer membrane protein OmpA-like peptidoglycan-associated protein